MPHPIRVGVLRGGPSNEYEVSLKTGANILGVLNQHFPDTHRPVDIFIDQDGIWHIEGVSISPDRALSKVDVVFNALHGSYGEDGKIQHILETHRTPFTGSGSLASAVGMNKILTKKALAAHGIKTPMWREVSVEDIVKNYDELLRDLFQTCILPVVVKPASGGSSLGASLVRNYDEFPQAFYTAGSHGPIVLIEEYIPGAEATCGVVEGFRGHELYALPPVEIQHDSELFGYDEKYLGKSREIVPAGFSSKLKGELEDLARSVHNMLGLRHYSRSDFIIHPRRGIYVLEVNTLPGLTNESLITKSLHAVGSGLHEFVGHVLALARGEK